MEFVLSLQKILHYATLPEAMGLFCVLVFMLGQRKRGRLLFLTLSLSVSTCLLLKDFFKVPRPWWPDVSTAPYLAEGGYAMPCLHTQLTSAVFCFLALTSKRRWSRYFCSAVILGTALWRVLAGLQSITDILMALICGLICALLIFCINFKTLKKTQNFYIDAFVIIIGLAAAVFLQDGWGLGSGLTAVILRLLENGFQRADPERTTFGKFYGTIFAAGIYAGLIIFLPFLIEWLITPFWPGQTLIVLLITMIPCLLRLFPVF